MAIPFVTLVLPATGALIMGIREKKDLKLKWLLLGFSAGIFLSLLISGIYALCGG